MNCRHHRIGPASLSLGLVCCLSFLLCARSARAQYIYETGAPTFTTSEPVELGFINVSNGNLHLQVPLTSPTQRGSIPYVAKLVYDSRIWKIAANTWSPSNVPSSQGGWRKIEAGVGTVGFSHGISSCTYTCGPGGKQCTAYWDTYERYYYKDFSGATHYFPIYFETGCVCHTPGTSTNSGPSTDGTGYSMSATTVGVDYVKAVDGSYVYLPPGDATTPRMKDTNGNYYSLDASGHVHDTLDHEPLTWTTDGNTTTYTIQTPQGHSDILVTTQPVYVHTAFGKSGVTEYQGHFSAIDSIQLPGNEGSYHFTYDSGTSDTDPAIHYGLLTSVTLPTGAQITYAHAKRTDVSGNINMWVSSRSSGGGTWSFGAPTSCGTNCQKLTETKPGSDQTVYTFTLNNGAWSTIVEAYQGAAGGTLLLKAQNDYTSYPDPVNGGSGFVRLFRTTSTLSGTGGSAVKKTEYAYDHFTYNYRGTTYDGSNGLFQERREYAFGSPNPGGLVRKTLISYAVYNRPASVTIQDGAGNTAAQTTYTYDEGGVESTTGTPHLTTGSSPRGNLTTLAYTGSALTRKFTYFDTGNVKTATDVNNQVTNYTYGNCNNSFLSNVSMPLGLSRALVWNCTGGVITSATDENGNVTSYSFGDQNYWRPTSITDPFPTTTNISYFTGPHGAESDLDFNGGGSTLDLRTTLDGWGRVHLRQRKQGPSSSTYDSVQTDHDAFGSLSRVTVPYTGAAGQTNDAGPATTTSYDAIGRPLLVTDAAGGTVGYSYVKNDVLQTVGPPPPGENTKSRQFEYDALGRLTSVCEITNATGSGSCAQASAQTGYWTTYAYDVLDNLISVTQNAHTTPTQTRSYSCDALGRVISATDPESGTTQYTYDSDATCGASNGDRVKRIDAVGNVTCYAYDAIHRLTDVTYPTGDYAARTPAKHFVYDSATVNGQTMQNAKGRLAEAYTGSSKTTDLGFNYGPTGLVEDVYQKTPNSGGYYRVTAGYWPNGLLSTLNMNLTGVPSWTYTPDAEGRAMTVGASSGTNPVPTPGATYNVAGQPTGVNFGSLDSDAFAYDSNTGRMTQYTFNIGSAVQSVIGNLTWNGNGSLQQLAITDPFNASNQQTCTYGFDDLARIKSVDCGAAWSQTFGFDAFGNIMKSGTISFQPTYNPATNRYDSIPGVPKPPDYYDLNGNLTRDGLHTYAWDAERRPVTVSSVSLTYDLTYDALGRMVEQDRSGVYTQIVYSPLGNKLALMNGQTLSMAFVPLPAGATAVYAGSSLTYYRHPDWLGSSRFASTPSRTMYYDGAYAPYGENYAELGTADRNFTGQNQDTISSGSYPLYDFLYRELHPVHGRWLSPDPVAGSIYNPQSLNRYAYVLNNPVNFIDPLGLDGTPPPGMVCEPSDKDCKHPHRPSCTTMGCVWQYYGNTICFIGGHMGPCPMSQGYFNTGRTDHGYDIFDAMMGAPGTYLTLDIHGNVGFGFDEGLWMQTWGFIDWERSKPGAGNVPTMGYVQYNNWNPAQLATSSTLADNILKSGFINSLYGTIDAVGMSKGTKLGPYVDITSGPGAVSMKITTNNLELILLPTPWGIMPVPVWKPSTVGTWFFP
jgi:RHS repeat-associated protein